MTSDHGENHGASTGARTSRLFRALLSVLVPLAILLAATVGVMSTPWFRRTLERQVLLRLEDLTGARATIHSMHFNPVILEITLHGLTLRGSELPSQPPLFTAKTVVARVSLVPLARRKLRLRELDWENAAIHLRTNPDGSTNFPAPRTWVDPGRTMGQLAELSIGRLNLARTEVDWNDRRLPIELDARSVAILLRDNGAHRYAGSFSSSATRVRADSWSPPPLTLTGQFEISSATLNVKSITWQSTGITGQGTFSLRRPDSPEGSFSFQSSADGVAMARLLARPELRGGMINLEGQGNYGPGGFTVRGQVQARKLVLQSSAFSPGPVDLSADYVADRLHAEFSNLAVWLLGGNARGRLVVSFRRPTPDFVWRGQIRGLEMPAALRSFARARAVLSRIPQLATIDGTAEATWSGRLENFKSQFDFQFHGQSGGARGSVPLSGQARGRLGMVPGFSLDIEDAQFQTLHSALSVHGQLGGPQSNLAFKLLMSEFQEWRRLAEFICGVGQPIRLSLLAAATVSGTVAGTLARPELHARLETGAFEYGSMRWDAIEGSVTAAPDSISISSARLRGGQSVLTFDAWGQLEDWVLESNSLLHLSVRAEKTPVEVLNVAFDLNQTLSGFATGHLDLEGTAANLSGSGVLGVEQGAIVQEPFDLLSTNIRVAASVWSFERIELTKGHGRLAGELHFDLSQHLLSIELRGSDFSLTEFRHLSFDPPGSPWIAGRAEFDLRGTSTPGNSRLTSTCNIRDIQVEGQPVGDLSWKLDWDDRQMRFAGRSQGPGGIVRFGGEVRTEADWPLDLKGEYENLRTDPWIHLLADRSLNAVVIARGTFGVTGPLKQANRLEAHSQTQELEVRFPALVWKNEHPFDLRYAGGVLAADRFRMRGPSTDLEVEGSIRFGKPWTLSLNAQGQAEAALLNLLDPALQATGSSDLNLRVSASLSPNRPVQPLLNGRLAVHDVSLKYAELPFRVSSLNGEIQLEGERAASSSLRGKSGGGSVTFSGFTTLSETPRFDLRADLDQVRVTYPDDFTSVLNASLRVLGTSERAELAGEVTVRQMFVSQNVNLLTFLSGGSTPIEKRFAGVSSPLASKVRVSVRLNSSAPLRLEGRDWKLLADLDLSLRGTLASPVVVGVIRARSGEALLAGNRYRLNRGEIRLSNLFHTQPVLDLEASTRVQRYELTVNISGLLDRLKLSYRSDPPLPTEDVLSLLALGFSQQEQAMSTAAGRPLPTAQAGALLSQALSSQMSGRVQRLFGVSRIKVDPNVLGAGSTSGARVTFEQQVTRDLTLTYVTNTATSQYRVIQFEWALTEHTSLIGVRDQNGIFGVEVKFRKRFR